MSVVVVIKNQGRTTIIEGPITRKKVLKMVAACGQPYKPERINVWNILTIEYVLEWYYKISCKEIAENLSIMTGNKYTKNMVISIYNKIKRNKANASKAMDC